MWDVKQQVSAGKGEAEEALRSLDSASLNLTQMRWGMKIAVFAIVAGFGILITSVRFHAL